MARTNRGDEERGDWRGAYGRVAAWIALASLIGGIASLLAFPWGSLATRLFLPAALFGEAAIVAVLGVALSVSGGRRGALIANLVLVVVIVLTVASGVSRLAQGWGLRGGAPLDWRGRVVLPDDYEHPDAGLLDVSVSYEWFGRGLRYSHGYIDENGVFVIPPQFDVAGAFNDGVAVVSVDDEYGVIDASGTWFVLPGYTSCLWRFRNHRLGVEALSGLWGFVDPNGVEVIAPRFDEVRHFYENYAAVRIGDLWGYVDQSGEMIEPQFDEAQYFAGGLAAVRTGDLWGYVDRHGEYAIPPRFGEAWPLSDDRAAVNVGGFTSAMLECRGGAWGYVDNEGKLAIPPRFPSPSWFDAGVAKVELGAHEFRINKQGGIVGTRAPAGDERWTPRFTAGQRREFMLSQEVITQGIDSETVVMADRDIEVTVREVKSEGAAIDWRAGTLDMVDGDRQDIPKWFRLDEDFQYRVRTDASGCPQRLENLVAYQKVVAPTNGKGHEDEAGEADLTTNGTSEGGSLGISPDFLEAFALRDMSILFGACAVPAIAAESKPRRELVWLPRFGAFETETNLQVLLPASDEDVVVVHRWQQGQPAGRSGAEERSRVTDRLFVQTIYEIDPASGWPRDVTYESTVRLGDDVQYLRMIFEAVTDD